MNLSKLLSDKINEYRYINLMKRNCQLKYDIFNKVDELAEQKDNLEYKMQKIQVSSLTRNLSHILNSIIRRITHQTRDLAISQLSMLFNGLVYHDPCSKAFSNKSTQSFIFFESYASNIKHEIDANLCDKLKIFYKKDHIFGTILQIVIYA